MGRHGENIRKRKDGRWEARIVIGYDLNGRARYHSIYGKTYPEVKEKRNRFLREIDFSQKPSANTQKITVRQLMNEWLISKKDCVKESTLAHYIQLTEKHLLPELGHYYLASLNNEIVNTFLKRKLHFGKLNGEGKLSSKTVADIRSVLIQGLEYAHQKNYPCMNTKNIFYPKKQISQIQVLTLEEQRQLEKILFYNPTPLKLGILISLYGGLRIGEVCALRWGDIHFLKGTIAVNKTLIRIQETSVMASSKTKVLIDRPKTESSCRVIPMPSFIMTLLKEHCEDPDIYLLTGTRTPQEPRVCLTKYKRVLRQAGLESFTFHALRHTFATRCVESGFDAKSLSEILGHANVNTTLQRYVHPSIDLKRTQMERLEKISIQGQNRSQKRKKA